MNRQLSIFSLVVLMAFILLSFTPTQPKGKSVIANVTKTDGISFIEADWNKALAEAKALHKLIFLDAYTTWCVPCKMLKKTTFSDKATGDFFNKNFVNVAVDMEKGFGPHLLKKYGVDAFPTLLIINEHGEVVQFTRGFIPAEVLIEFGKDALAKN